MELRWRALPTGSAIKKKRITYLQFILPLKVVRVASPVRPEIATLAISHRTQNGDWFAFNTPENRNRYNINVTESNKMQLALI